MKKLKNKFSHSKAHKQLAKTSFLMLFFGVLALISLYLLSPLNRVQSLNTNGNVQVPDEVILQESQITSEMPLWGTWLDQSYHEDLLVNKLDQIEAAEISLDGLQSLNIDVSELAVVAQVTDGDNDVINILENHDYSKSDYPMTASVPLLVGFDLEDELIEDMVNELADTNLAVLSLMSEIELIAPSRNPRLLQVNMNDGNQVLVNIPNFANQINYYPLLKDAVDNQSGVFDLEAGTYFTPYNSESEAEENYKNETSDETTEDQSEQTDLDTSDPVNQH